MKPPIFVVSDDSSVMSYERVELAEANLEAIDVFNEEFEVFDADGRSLRISAASDDAPVVITDAPERAPEPERLRRILFEHLLVVQSVRPELVDLTRPELLKASLSRLILEMQVVDERFRQQSISNRLRRLKADLLRRLSKG
jgi:hypothetical protein